MNKKTKRFFVLKNIKSQFIEQAIFVLKEKPPEKEREGDVLREAEMIIDNYLKRMGYKGLEPKNKQRKKMVLYSTSIVLGLVTTIYFVMRFI